MEILQKPLPEQKDVILQYVKEINSKTAAIETKVKDMLLQLSTLENNSAELRATRKDDSDKFKLIKAKSLEIDSLMKKLADERAKLDEKVVSIQKEIEMASEDKHSRKKAQSDLTEIKFLETELDASKYTAAQLEIELRLRREEIAKLDKAEVTCIKEISDLRADINDLEKKLALSLDVEQLRVNRTQELSQLGEVSRRLEAEETALAKELETKKSTLQAKLMRLSQNEIHGKLSRVDEKLKYVNDEIAKLSRTLESVQFTREKEKLGEMIGKVNDLLVLKQLEI
jgi:chromosome segregation ATPase